MLARALAGTWLFVVMSACCLTPSDGGSPYVIFVDDLHLTGDANGMRLTFALVDANDRRYALDGHVRLEIRENDRVVCSYERDVTRWDYRVYWPEVALDAVFSPPCPPPPPAYAARTGVFTFTSATTSFPPFVIHTLPEGLQGRIE